MQSGSTEPLLVFADELERRDADVASSLARVETLQREVEEIRSRGARVESFLAALPAARTERAADERAASAAVEEATAVLREAELAAGQAGDEAARLAAARAVAEAEDRVRAAERWAAQARTAVERLEHEATSKADEADDVERGAYALAGQVRYGPPPAPGLAGALEWAARVRGSLLLERSGLAREREEVVREATELVTSVLGEPAHAAAVAGVRSRLERALGRH